MALSPRNQALAAALDRAPVRIGIVGTGFVASGYAQLIAVTPGYEVSGVLTRRDLRGVHFPLPCLTNSLAELLDTCDIVLLTTGDPIHGTEVLWGAMAAGKPVITLDSELQVTTASYFVTRGYVTEADGDQPGCLARLRDEAVPMGFEPLAYVNIKGFLNPDPAPDEMKYWSDRQRIRLEQVISFTDGTKLQIEQALVANGLGAAISQDGLIGGSVDGIHDTDYLGDRARELGRPVSDYVVCGSAPPGVFLLAQNPIAAALEHYGPFAKLKTSGGRYYVLLRPFHLCQLEIVRTLGHVVAGEPPLLNNSPRPEVGVAAIAKRAVRRGERIERALGSFDFRGRAVRIADHPNHVPIGLLANAVAERDLEPGEEVGFADVDLQVTRALEIYGKIRDDALAGG